MPERTFTETQVRLFIESAWCAGYYHDRYTHDSAYADEQATRCANVFFEEADMIFQLVGINAKAQK